MNRYVTITAATFVILLCVQLVAPTSFVLFSLETAERILPKLRYDFIYMESATDTSFALYYVNMYLLSFVLGITQSLCFIIVILAGPPPVPASFHESRGLVKSISFLVVWSIFILYVSVFYRTPFYAPGKSASFSVHPGRFAFIFVILLNWVMMSSIVAAVFLICQYIRSMRRSSNARSS